MQKSNIFWESWFTDQNRDLFMSNKQIEQLNLT